MGALIAEFNYMGIAGITVGFGLLVVMPIIGLLLSHQRQMASIIHGRTSERDANDERVLRLENEVRELRARLDDQIIRADDRERTLYDRIKQLN